MPSVWLCCMRIFSSWRGPLGSALAVAPRGAPRNCGVADGKRPGAGPCREVHVVRALRDRV